MPTSEDAVVEPVSPIEEAPMLSTQEAAVEPVPVRQEAIVSQEVLDQINKFIREAKKNHPEIIIEYSDGWLEIGCEGKINDILQSLSSQFWCKTLKSLKIDDASFKVRNLNSVLSKMTNLQELHLANTDLGTKEENFLKSLGKTLSSLSNLKLLDLYNCNLGDALITLLPDVTEGSNLEELYLDVGDLDQVDTNKLNILNNKLLSLSKLKVLDLSGPRRRLAGLFFPIKLNNLNNRLTELLPSLIEARDPQTRYLDLSGKGIGSLGPKELQTLNKALLSCSHLKVLDLNDNHLGNKLITLLPAIKKMQNLKSLDLYGNDLEKIDKDKLNDLNEFLLTLPKLELLEIDGGNRLTKLLPSLIEARDPQTRYLDLRHKDIRRMSPKELQTLNKALLSCSHLELLDLTDNCLGDKLVTLLPAIQGMHNLKKLSLLNTGLNTMSEKDLDALSKALSSNLKLLDLSGNNLGSKLTTLLPAIKKMHNLEKLGLRNVGLNTMGEKDLDALSKALSSNLNLEVLDLSGNKLGSKLTTLLPAIKKMKKLKTLYLYDLMLNTIDKKDLDALREGLLSLSNLEELSLSWNLLGNKLITLFSPIKEKNLQNLNLANLQRLNLTYNGLNKMSHDEWQAFLAELSGLSKLQVLNLRDSFDNSALNAFIEALSQMESFAGIPNLRHDSSESIAKNATHSLELKLYGHSISGGEQRMLRDALTAFNPAIKVTFK